MQNVSIVTIVSCLRPARVKLRHAFFDQAAGDAEERLRSGMVKRPLSPAMLDEPTGMLRSQSPSYANSTIHRPCATRDQCQGCVVSGGIPTRRVSEGTIPVASHHDNRMSLANASGCHAKHFKAGNCSAMECKMFRMQPLSPVFGLPGSNCATHSWTNQRAIPKNVCGPAWSIDHCPQLCWMNRQGCYDHKVRRTPIRQYTGHAQLAINARDASLAKPSQPDALARERHRLHRITTIARPSLTRRVAIQSTSKRTPVRQWNAKFFDGNHCLLSSACELQTALRTLGPSSRRCRRMFAVRPGQSTIVPSYVGRTDRDATITKSVVRQCDNTPAIRNSR